MNGALDPQVMSLALVACRVTACLVTAPGFSSPRVGSRARLFLALLASVLIEPVVREAVARDVSGGSPAFMLAILRETLIGAAFGLSARLCMAMFEMAGAAISAAIGMSFAFGPAPGSDEPIPTLAAFLNLTALMMFFAAGLDAAMLRGLVGSYSAFAGPPAGGGAAAWLALMLDTLRDASAVALQIAGPLLALSLFANFCFSVVSRFMPQVPIFFVVAPLLIGLGLALLLALHKPVFTLLIDLMSRRIAAV